MSDPDFRLYCGQATSILESMAPGVLQTIITSPPYWGLRDYGVRGQIGLGAFEDYMRSILLVFAAAKLALHPQGTLWLNLGDSYATRHGGGSTKSGFNERWYGKRYASDKQGAHDEQRPRSVLHMAPGAKPKDLLGLPWTVALALRDQGWYLRQEIIWEKPNAMPSSVRDRFTTSHEHVFLLSRSPSYYFDVQAVAEDAVSAPRGRAASFKREGSTRAKPPGQTMSTHRAERPDVSYSGDKRRRRSVWRVSTRRSPDAHFATFPPELVRPMILAGSKPGDLVCDPFMGTGTTGVVALEEGRRFVGVDINPEYVAISRRRLEAVGKG